MALGAATVAFTPSVSFSAAHEPVAFVLPALDYPYNALEPHFDSVTMEIHHSKHHAAYVKKLNEAVQNTNYVGLSLEKLLKKIKPTDLAIRNNAGGHYNHSLFWQLLSPKPGAAPESLLKVISENFGSMEDFQDAFTKAGLAHFGSGWVWLVQDKKALRIMTTPNQDNPLMENILEQKKIKPLIALDVWEHAYYLKYQNKRTDYIKAFWQVLNWEAVAKQM